MIAPAERLHPAHLVTDVDVDVPINIGTATATETQTETGVVAHDADAPRARSGGPRTAEGKERSRRNAMKHGLRASILVPDDMADEADRRAIEFAGEFAP